MGEGIMLHAREGECPSPTAGSVPSPGDLERLAEGQRDAVASSDQVLCEGLHKVEAGVERLEWKGAAPFWGSGKNSDAVSDEILVHAHLEFSIC